MTQEVKQFLENILHSCDQNVLNKLQILNFPNVNKCLAMTIHGMLYVVSENQHISMGTLKHWSMVYKYVLRWILIHCEHKRLHQQFEKIVEDIIKRIFHRRLDIHFWELDENAVSETVYNHKIDASDCKYVYTTDGLVKSFPKFHDFISVDYKKYFNMLFDFISYVIRILDGENEDHETYIDHKLSYALENMTLILSIF